MKKIYTFLFLVMISCNKKVNITETYFLIVKNNTSNFVNITFFKKDTTIINSFNVAPKKLVNLDTSIIKILQYGKGRNEIDVIKGQRTPYWTNNDNLMNYKFEDFKISVFQHTPGGECDTSNINSLLLCNFMKKNHEKKEILESTNLEIIETATFYITQHQLAGADSI